MNDEQTELAGFTVQISDIIAHCNPLHGQEWGCEPIDPAAVIEQPTISNSRPPDGRL